MADDDFDIAVIGMACRLPGAPSVDAFWNLLRTGTDAGVVFSDAELLASGADPAAIAAPDFVRVGYPLADADRFDAGFFGLAADEAELLDPQHRQFLECAVEALEDAGHDPRGAHRVGVYAGCGPATYLADNLAERHRSATLPGRYRIHLANDKDFLATRVSHALDLTGPSVGVNTACSSSLVAVHLACSGLHTGDADVAIAGAAHVRSDQRAGYRFQQGMILSADGRCRPFDRAAGGTNVGNGVAIVVLKRLADALADGDTVRAVIKGTAINNDGRRKVGYSAPSVHGQAAVIADAWRAAGCDPGSVSYVEAHGTGTPLGDPVEVAALTEVFAERPPGSIALGAVKANVGHLDAAAGVVGLIKTCLQLAHRKWAPIPTLVDPHPTVSDSPLRPVPSLEDWPGPSPRRAGVSSFGIGGTNAHVVVEEAPPAPAAVADRRPHLLVVSAKTPEALARGVANLARALNRGPGLSLADVAFTLAEGRVHHDHRAAVVCGSVREAAMALALGDGVVRGHAGAGQAEVRVPADADEATLREVGKRWVAGAALRGMPSARRIPLPTYPFERQRYWVDPAAPATARRPTLAVRLAAAPLSERVPLAVGFLSDLVTELVGHPPPSPDANLFELGLDSLMLIEVAARLSAELGAPVPASGLVRHPNLRAFATHLVGALDR